MPTTEYRVIIFCELLAFIIGLCMMSDLAICKTKYMSFIIHLVKRVFGLIVNF